MRLNSWAAVALGAAVCLAYAPALRVPFIFDDVAGIVENASIRRLWPPSVPLSPPAGGTAVSGRPVANYSLALDYGLNDLLGVSQRAGAEDPARVVSFRVTNLLLHLFCGSLLFGVIRRTFRSPPISKTWSKSGDRLAAITTAIWLLHPLQTEAVNYAVQRTELLVSACWLATLYAWIRAWDATSPTAVVRWRVAAVIACVLGMGSKEVMIGAPLAVILYDRAFHITSWSELVRARERVVFYLLLAATSALLLWSIVSGARADSVGFGLGIPWYRYLYSQGWAIGHYVSLVFWPDPLTIDYGKNAISGLRPLPGLILVAASGLATIWAWTRVERWGWLAFSGAWFFLLLAPSSSFVPIISEIAAERRIYLALAALILVLVVAVEATLRAVSPGSDRRQRDVSRVDRRRAALVTGLCVLLAALTAERSVTYASPEALWRQVVKVWPQNARGYTNLGQLLSEQPARYPEAEDLFAKAIAIDSTLTTAWIDLAYIKTKEGRLSDAEAELGRAMSIRDPANHDKVVERYGRTLLGMGDLHRAIPLLERSVATSATAENLFWLGAGYSDAERLDDAVAVLRRCLSLDPTFAMALRYIGRALIESGHAPEAVPYLETAVVQQPRAAVNLALLSLALATTGRTKESADAASASATLGDDAEASVFSGRAMMQLHRPGDARKFFAEAVRLRPDDWVSLTRLGLADAELGDEPAAEGAFRRALALNPGYEAAREALGELKRKR